MTPTEITHSKAVEIDTQLADLWSAKSALHAKLDSAKISLAHKLGIRPQYVTRNRREVKETLAELVEMGEARLPSLEGNYQHRDLQDNLARIVEIKEALKANQAEALPLETLYDENQWSRFFLVNNNGGHIHSSMSCHSCNLRTQFGWLPQLSGLTEKDAVEAHGTILCTHCYPTAPVEWTLGITKAADPNECPGSGTYDYDPSTRDRRGYNSAGRAKCTHCNQVAACTTTGKLRKHKRAA